MTAPVPRRRVSQVGHGRGGRVLAALLLSVLPTASWAEEFSCDLGCWRRAMAAYAANPSHERGRLFTLERLGTDALPPEILLLLADAHLRSGHERAAEQLFARVSGEEAAEPFRTWALLGGAWMAASAGDVDRAVTLLGGANQEAFFEPAATLLLGYLEASRGAPSGAERLRELLSDARATSEVRSAARMMLGLTYYWSGATEAARREFQTVADDDGGVLKDEAAYAVARMMLAEGRVAETKVRLERLTASGADAGTGKPPADLVDLEQRALVRVGLRGYRRGALSAPTAQVLRLLEWNGVALAKALLARLEREGEERPGRQLALVEVPGPHGGAVAATRTWEEAAEARVAPSEPATRVHGPEPLSTVAPRSEGSRPRLLGWAAIVAVALSLALLRRAAHRSSKR